MDPGDGVRGSLLSRAKKLINRQFVGGIMKLKFKIYKHIGDISHPNNGWTKELNYVSWDDREPVYDIRTWSSDHTEYGKGVTITQGEMKRLQELIKDTMVF